MFEQTYHWSFMQVEYATDLVFRSTAILQSLYQQLCRQAVLSVKAEHIATFLGLLQITPNLVQRLATNSQPGSKAPASSITTASPP